MTYEEAITKAKEFASKTPRIQNDLERREFEREYATRLQFEANFDAWLQIRSAEGDGEDEEQGARCDREDYLAHLILTAPAVYDWMIFRKFEVVDYYLTKHAEASWGELLALTALSAIRADILRLGLTNMELARANAKTGADRPAA